MANQQLVDYIKSQLALGVTKQDLQKAITSAGWSMQDSNEGFLAAEGKTPPAPEVPKTPAPPLQPMPASPAMGGASITPIARPAAAFNPRPPVQIDTPRSLTWLWVALGILALIVVVAGAYMYVPTVRTVVDFYLGGGTVTAPPAPGTDTTPPATSETATTTSGTPSHASTTSGTTTNASVGASTTAH